MFYDTPFNQTLENWDVSNVTKMNSVFANAENYNHPLNNWDVSNVTDMESMFSNASSFDQPINTWNVSNVTNMRLMFDNAIAFNQDLNTWIFHPNVLLSDFLNFTSLDINKYDSLLQSFNSQNLVNKILDVDGLAYCDEASRDNLMNSKNWLIKGDFKGQCGVVLNTSSTPFVTTWSVTADDLNIKIYTSGAYNYDFDIDWGDGTSDQNVSSTISHTYTNPGDYTIGILGIFPSFKTCEKISAETFCDNSNKLISVDSFGDQEWRNLYASFAGASNLTINTSQPPNFAFVNNMDYAFINCTALNQNINNWDVSNVTSMRKTFKGASDFNRPLSNWNVSHVRDMEAMFQNASSFNSFNQSLNNWDVSNVRDMEAMFQNASSFNQPLNNWDVSKVTNMRYMFNNGFINLSTFNQDISNWDTSNVTDMQSMFENARSFNQPLNNWDVSNVTSMRSMFNTASSFNQPLNNWDVSNVTNMGFMFKNGTFFDISMFNQDISNWDTSNVTDMQKMFWRAESFNQSLNNWNVSNVTDMNSMFYNAESFNQPLNNWDVSNVSDMQSMFFGASSFNQPLSNWDVSNVTDMRIMFWNASSFNQDISTWCVENISSEPHYFSEDAPLLDSFTPVWGAACTLSIQDNTALSVKIYPNPTQAIVFIENAQNFNTKSIEIYNMQGKVVKEVKVLDQEQVQIDLSDLASGMYILKVSNHLSQNFVKRIIKN